MAVTKSGESLKLKDSLKLGLCIKYVSSFIMYINDFITTAFLRAAYLLISSHLIVPCMYSSAHACGIAVELMALLLIPRLMSNCFISLFV